MRSSIALIAPFTAILALGIRKAWITHARREPLRIALSFALVPPVVTFVGSNVAPHAFWESRYLIIAAAPYFVLIAVAIGSLDVRVRRIAVAGTAAFLLYGAVQLSLWPEPRVDIESVARRIASEPAPAYSFDHPLGYTLQYFIQQHGKGTVAPVNDTVGIHDSACWIITTNHHGGAVDPISTLERSGYRQDQTVVARDEWNEITAVRIVVEKKTAPAEP